jgi:hypothetical protein
MSSPLGSPRKGEGGHSVNPICTETELNSVKKARELYNDWTRGGRASVSKRGALSSQWLKGKRQFKSHTAIRLYSFGKNIIICVSSKGEAMFSSQPMVRGLGWGIKLKKKKNINQKLPRT